MKFLPILLLSLTFFACEKNATKEEQIRVDSSTETNEERDTVNSVAGGLGLEQISTFPQRVIMNGMPQHRLVTIYKYIPPMKESRGSNFYSSFESGEYWDDDQYQHFMPGLDLLFGYNLLNLAHYDMKSEKLNYLFSKPVLVKSVYYPSFVPDSVGKNPNRKPITRDYFLVSAYDEDTNGDTLLNRHDLRRFYHFNASCDVKTQLIPPDYSVLRSEYDRDNDVMFIYARNDANKNGKSETSEPIHVFWISLKTLGPAKRMY